MTWEAWLMPAIIFVAVIGALTAFILMIASWRQSDWRGRFKKATPRLKVVETLNIDTKRRLILVSRDNQMHLIMLGMNQDVVVESNIAALAPANHYENVIKHQLKDHV